MKPTRQGVFTQEDTWDFQSLIYSEPFMDSALEIPLDRNPFITRKSTDVIPGPVSLRCDNRQFMEAWLKYFIQSAMCVLSHALSFVFVVLWLRFIFDAHYHHHSAWTDAAIYFTNITFFSGFMMQLFVIPIQWNFEKGDNARMFIYFASTLVIIVVLCNATFYALQIYSSFTALYDLLLVCQVFIVLVFSFILWLFVIITNAEHSKSKLIFICGGFSVLITLSLGAVYIQFQFVLPRILTSTHFVTYALLNLLAALFIGELLMCCMRVLMRCFASLLSLDTGTEQHPPAQQHRYSISSVNTNYGCMQTLNRMVLFVIPLIFVTKLSILVIIYAFVGRIQFLLAVLMSIACSALFNQLFTSIGDKLSQRFLSLNQLQDQQLAAQYKFVYTTIEYIVMLLVPVAFLLFNVDLSPTHNQSHVSLRSLSPWHYVQNVLMQLLLQFGFDLIPMLIILCGNITCKERKSSVALYYFSSTHDAVESRRSGLSICSVSTALKMRFINMWNVWTATEKCVGHFLWWCTIFIAGYFAFYVLYPQQFLCAANAEASNQQVPFLVDSWVYVRCL